MIGLISSAFGPCFSCRRGYDSDTEESDTEIRKGEKPTQQYIQAQNVAIYANNVAIALVQQDKTAKPIPDSNQEEFSQKTFTQKVVVSADKEESPQNEAAPALDERELVVKEKDESAKEAPVEKEPVEEVCMLGDAWIEPEAQPEAQPEPQVVLQPARKEAEPAILEKEVVKEKETVQKVVESIMILRSGREVPFQQDLPYHYFPPVCKMTPRWR